MVYNINVSRGWAPEDREKMKIETRAQAKMIHAGDLVRYKNPDRWLSKEPYKFEIGLVTGYQQGLPLVAFPSWTGTVSSRHVEVL